jgi:arsenate reductase
MGNKTVNVMLLCTANSCRSQMAEGLARHFGKGIVEPCSAGLFAFHVHPKAIQVMSEIGIDITGHTSKALEIEMLKEMNFLITLCEHAESSCPAVPPVIKRLHWPIRDPVGMIGTENEIINDFRRARDEIRNKVERFINDIRKKSA